MRYLTDGSQMKRADRYTIQEVGIPSLELMERAAAACVEVMDEEGLDLSRVCIVCGSGNNGGDGFAIARILKGRGYPGRGRLGERRRLAYSGNRFLRREDAFRL